MTPEVPAFNLLDEPWVRVRRQGGELAELSLRAVFDEAPQIRALAGEVPTQDVAILRLLVAVLFAATRPARLRSEEESWQLWAKWWRSGSLPPEVNTYFDQHHDRFFLLGGQAPFLQVPDLRTASGNSSGLVKLIADVPDGNPYFTTRAGAELESLSYAEAARWLVHCHAFDPAGIKTGAVGDDRVKGGKGYSMGYPAFAGNLGIIVLRGVNLFETMLLNAPLSLVRDLDDRPAWERSLTAAVATEHPVPSGPADVLTWPSRRVRLFPGAGRVVEVQISNGDPLGPQNQYRNEPMSSWRKSDPQTKKLGTEVYMPATHSPERRIWQGLGSLLVTAEGVSRRAEVLEWLATMRYLEVLPAGKVIELRTIGIEYGVQASSIAGVIDDGLHLGVAGLTDPVLIQAAVDGAARAGHAVVALVKLAGDLAAAAGGESDRPRQRTFELGYALLDAPYRDWVARLDDAEVAAERLEEWGSQARRILLDAGRDLITQAGPAAIVGREIARPGTDKTQLVDAGLAEIWFRAALSKALISPASTVQTLEAAS